jgi:DNA repair protein RecO (recombination protein O)
MRTIEKTEAVVLRSMKYLESSKIVTLYTAEYGKLSVIAKGARQRKNKYGAALEPMTHLSAIVYRKDGRNLQVLGDCDIVHPFRRLMEDLDKMSVGLAVIELMNIVTHEEEKNSTLFALLVETLHHLDIATEPPSLLLYFFELHLSSILGFHPAFELCAGCGKNIRGHGGVKNDLWVLMGSGGFLHEGCYRESGAGYHLSVKAFDLLLHLLDSPPGSVMEGNTRNKPVEDEVGRFLWTYMQYHIPGIKLLKSQKIFSVLLQSA